MTRNICIVIDDTYTCIYILVSYKIMISSITPSNKNIQPEEKMEPNIKLRNLIEEYGATAMFKWPLEAFKDATFPAVSVEKLESLEGLTTSRISVSRSRGGPPGSSNSGPLDEMHLYDFRDLYPYLIHLKMLYVHQYMIGHSILLRSDGIVKSKTLTPVEHLVYGVLIGKVLLANGMYRKDMGITKGTREYANFFLRNFAKLFNETMKGYNGVHIDVKRGGSVSSFDKYLPYVLSKISVTDMRKALTKLNYSLDRVVYFVTGNNDFTIKSETHHSAARERFVHIFENAKLKMKYKTGTSLTDEIKDFDAFETKIGSNMISTALITQTAAELIITEGEASRLLNVRHGTSLIMTDIGMASQSEFKMLEMVWVDRGITDFRLKASSRIILSEMEIEDIAGKKIVKIDSIPTGGHFSTIIGSKFPALFAEEDDAHNLARYVYIPNDSELVSLITHKGSVREAKVTKDMTSVESLAEYSPDGYKIVNRDGSVRLDTGVYIMKSEDEGGGSLFASTSAADVALLERYIGDFVESRVSIISEVQSVGESAEEVLKHNDPPIDDWQPLASAGDVIPGMKELAEDSAADIRLDDPTEPLLHTIEILAQTSMVRGDVLDISFPPPSDLIDPEVRKAVKSITRQPAAADGALYGLAEGSNASNELKNVRESVRDLTESFKEMYSTRSEDVDDLFAKDLVDKKLSDMKNDVIGNLRNSRIAKSNYREALEEDTIERQIRESVVKAEEETDKINIKIDELDVEKTQIFRQSMKDKAAEPIQVTPGESTVNTSVVMIENLDKQSEDVTMQKHETRKLVSERKSIMIKNDAEIRDRANRDSASARMSQIRVSSQTLNSNKRASRPSGSQNETLHVDPAPAVIAKEGESEEDAIKRNTSERKSKADEELKKKRADEDMATKKTVDEKDVEITKNQKEVVEKAANLDAKRLSIMPDNRKSEYNKLVDRASILKQSKGNVTTKSDKEIETLNTDIKSLRVSRQRDREKITQEFDALDITNRQSLDKVLSSNTTVSSHLSQQRSEFNTGIRKELEQLKNSKVTKEAMDESKERIVNRISDQNKVRMLETDVALLLKKQLDKIVGEHALTSSSDMSLSAKYLSEYSHGDDLKREFYTQLRIQIINAGLNNTTYKSNTASVVESMKRVDAENPKNVKYTKEIAGYEENITNLSQMLEKWGDLGAVALLEAGAINSFGLTNPVINRNKLFSSLAPIDANVNHLSPFMKQRNSDMRAFEKEHGWNLLGGSSDSSRINADKYKYLPLLICVNMNCPEQKVYGQIVNSLRSARLSSA